MYLHRNSKMKIDRKFLNVNILGLAFMLIFTAFQTMGNIQASSLYHDILISSWQTDKSLNKFVLVENSKTENETGAVVMCPISKTCYFNLILYLNLSSWLESFNVLVLRLIIFLKRKQKCRWKQLVYVLKCLLLPSCSYLSIRMCI